MTYRLAALLAALLFSVPATRAEVIHITPFTQADARAVPSCSVETIIGDELTSRWGCTIERGDPATAPDVRVEGEYWKSGENLFLTVRSFDTVIGRLVYSRQLYLPEEPEECFEAARLAADKIANPAFYDTKARFIDTVSGVEFILVPGGTFRFARDKRERWVTVPSFFIGKFEITQEQWLRIMPVNPSTFQASEEHPVENVSWLDVQEYISQLLKRTGVRYRLPTEMEWEYAARARGRDYAWSGTSEALKLEDFAWTQENAGGGTHPVGTKRANGLGLHDMSGNVWEWVSDRYDTTGSIRSLPGDEPPERVIRGGSWMTRADECKTCTREAASPLFGFRDNGFRIAISISDAPL